MALWSLALTTCTALNGSPTLHLAQTFVICLFINKPSLDYPNSCYLFPDGSWAPPLLMISSYLGHALESSEHCSMTSV